MKSFVAFVVLPVALYVVCFVCIALAVHRVVAYVDDHGLKGVAERVWNGRDQHLVSLTAIDGGRP